MQLGLDRITRQAHKIVSRIQNDIEHAYIGTVANVAWKEADEVRAEGDRFDPRNKTRKQEKMCQGPSAISAK